jgi:hypothetical protein
VIENRTDGPLREVHTRWARELDMRKLDVEGATVKRDFATFQYRISRSRSRCCPASAAPCA